MFLSCLHLFTCVDFCINFITILVSVAFANLNFSDQYYYNMYDNNSIVFNAMLQDVCNCSDNLN